VSAHDNAGGLSPDDYVQGELAAHADLALAELAVEVFQSPVDLPGALARLRLEYWHAWISAAGLWCSASERGRFNAVMRLTDAAAGRPDPVLLARVRAAGARDAAYELAGARLSRPIEPRPAASAATAGEPLAEYHPAAG
jgi:hypothetical protein